MPIFKIVATRTVYQEAYIYVDADDEELLDTKEAEDAIEDAFLGADFQEVTSEDFQVEETIKLSLEKVEELRHRYGSHELPIDPDMHFHHPKPVRELPDPRQTDLFLEEPT